MHKKQQTSQQCVENEGSKTQTWRFHLISIFSWWQYHILEKLGYMYLLPTTNLYSKGHFSVYMYQIVSLLSIDCLTWYLNV